MMKESKLKRIIKHPEADDNFTFGGKSKAGLGGLLWMCKRLQITSYPI